MLTRRQAIGGVAGAAAVHAQKPARPNIVFILIDDLRWDALGCTGHPFAETPNVDRLAREGAKFTNAFVTTPLCSPSRGSFLTGQYVHTHGILDNTQRGEESHKLVTWPRLLHDAGYETAYVGKWHMGNDDTPRPGFDRWVSFRGQGRFPDPELNIDGSRTQAKGYMTDILSDHAVEYIRQKHMKPFSLYLAHKAVHGPFTPAERHKDLYADRPVPRAPSVKDTLEGKPALRLRQVDAKRPVPPTDELVRNQIRCVKSIDEGVRRIYEALSSTGQLDNTLIVFTSDNGYLWGEHGLGDKRPFYEESIRIPMVARYPKLIKAGSTPAEMILNIDIGPTVLELAGAPARREMQGRSLLPVLGGKARGWRSSFLGEYFEEKQFPRIPTWQGVRDQRWKYIRYTNLEGMDELYDLQSDRYEMKNLIADPAAKKTLDAKRGELAKYLKETGA
jgi:N-acetylglucosamine-6-sulfatase